MKWDHERWGSFGGGANDYVGFIGVRNQGDIQELAKSLAQGHRDHGITTKTEDFGGEAESSFKCFIRAENQKRVPGADDNPSICLSNVSTLVVQTL